MIGDLRKEWSGAERRGEAVAGRQHDKAWVKEVEVKTSLTSKTQQQQKQQQ